MAETVRILLVGDVMTGRGIDQILPNPCPPELHERWIGSAEDYVRLAERANGPIPRRAGFDYPWGEALPAWREVTPDLAIANLETAVTRSDAWLDKGINYRMSPENVGCLEAAGFDACALANNHVLDWGRQGLVDTLEALARAGIGTAGAGADRAAARAPAILAAKAGPRVLLVSCVVADSGVPQSWAAREHRSGVNLVTLADQTVDAIARDLAAVRRPADIAVVSIHWGSNWGYGIEPAQRSFAQNLIRRAGVSIVHGHSSHHPKGVEVFDARLILYGCGDLLNDYEGISGYAAYRGDLVAAYLAEVCAADGRLAALRILPFRVRRLRLERPSESDVNWLAARLNREGAELGTRFAASGSKALYLERDQRQAAPNHRM